MTHDFGQHDKELRSNSLRSNERKSSSSYRSVKQTGPQVWEDCMRTQALLMEIVYVLVQFFLNWYNCYCTGLFLSTV